MVVEFIYADGTSDQMLPIHAAKKAYGIGRGDRGLCRPALAGQDAGPAGAARPDAKRLLGSRGSRRNSRPRVPEPESAQVWYPPVKKPPLADATFSFRTQAGPRGAPSNLPMLGGRVSLAEKSRLPDEARGEGDPLGVGVSKACRRRAPRRITSAYEEAGVALRAVLVAQREERNSVRLSLELVNQARTRVTGALFFPTSLA